MSNSEENLLEQLEGLLGERRRYEGWIAQLEAKRDISPSHVVDRVRSDYQARLESVMSVLRGRTSELEASSASLRSRIATIEGEESQRRDERAETELRALVGEFAEDQARDSMAHCDEALGLLAGEREQLSTELARVTEILTIVRPTQPPAPPTPEPEPEPVAEVEPPSPEFVADPEPEPEPQAFAATEPEPEPEPDFPPSAPDYAPPPAAAQLDDELAFLHSVVETKEPAHEGRRGDGSDLLPPPVLSAPKRTLTPPSAPAVSAPSPGLGNAGNRGPQLTPGSIPSFFKDMPTEQVKTLRCAECGTMNYPTEWYCERCGGELAAM